MAETIAIARPYARAVFEEAQATGTLAQWSELLQAAAQVAADESMRLLLANPRLAPQQKVDLFLEVCSAVQAKVSGDQGKEGGQGQGGIPETGRNLIHLLAENQRLTALPDIAALFEMRRAEAEQTIQAQLITAFAIGDEQRNKIAEHLKARLKRAVVLECTVDESLMGGAIIRAGDLVIDGSVRGQLKRLAAALQH